MKLSEFKNKVIEKFGEGYWKKFTNSEAYKTYIASKEKQLELIKNKPFAIDYITNPSEDLQLEAGREIITSIRDIKNPTDKVIEEVVKKIINNEEGIYLFILKYIENDLKEDKEEETNE